MSITKVKRAKRLQLSKMQTRIEQENCASCEFNASKYQNSSCTGCSAFEQLRNIGQELLNLSTAEKTNELIELENRRKLTRNYPTHSPDRKYKPVMNFMTLEIYYTHKNAGLNDKQIAEKLGVNQSTFRNWKRRTLMTRPYGVKNYE